MKRTIIASVFALAISTVLAAGGMAQQTSVPAQTAPASPAKMEKFNGVVEKVDEATKDVVVQFHTDKMTFSVGDSTKIKEGKKELSLSDLKKGMWASVGYKKEGNSLMAESISVSMPKMVTKKETPSEMKKENPSEKPSVEKK